MIKLITRTILITILMAVLVGACILGVVVFDFIQHPMDFYFL